MEIINELCLTSYIKDIYTYFYPFCYNINNVLYFDTTLIFRNTYCAQIAHLHNTLGGLRPDMKRIFFVFIKNYTACDNMNDERLYYKSSEHKLPVLFLATLC